MGKLYENRYQLILNNYISKTILKSKSNFTLLILFLCIGEGHINVFDSINHTCTTVEYHVFAVIMQLQGHNESGKGAK